MKILCTICARGGSKGLPGKNIKELHGKPLIQYTIEQAIESKLFEHIAVSSDSQEILDVALKSGANYTIKRPEELSNDTAGKIPAIKHCILETEQLSKTKYDLIVDLDATSPLRFVSDISNSIALLKKTKTTNVVTACPSRKSPYFNLIELNDKDQVRLSKPLKESVGRRQDSPKCFDMNASIYVWNRDKLINDGKVFYEDTQLYVMPEERSIDIDTELDWILVELLLSRRNSN